jgi:pimeloyl-ACP methyl ester carboxylesterase
MDQGVSPALAAHDRRPQPSDIRPVVSKLAVVLPNVEAMTLAGAGHIPHVTHPDAYVEAIRTFIRKNMT